MTKLLICLYIIDSFYFHLKYIMYMTNNVLGYARSDRDGRNGHNQNENPHGLQNHYHKVPILFKTMYVSVLLLFLIKKLPFVVFRPKATPLVPSV